MTAACSAVSARDNGGFGSITREAGWLAAGVVAGGGDCVVVEIVRWVVALPLLGAAEVIASW